MIRLFRVFIPASVLALLVCDIILEFLCFVVATHLVLDADPFLFLTDEGGLTRIALVVATITAGLYLSDLYERFRIRTRLELVQQMCVVIGGALLFQALLIYLNREWALPRWVMLVGSLLCLIVLPAWRVAYASLGARAFGGERLLYVGLSETARKVAEHFRDHPELGFQNVGYLDNQRHDNVDFLPWLGLPQEVKQVAGRVKPDRIAVGALNRHDAAPLHSLLELRVAGMVVEEISSLYELAFGRVCIHELRPSQLVFSGRFGASRSALALRDLYSWVIALMGTLITLPLMAVLAAAVKLTSRGPVLYRQTRIGIGGKPFVLYKFRSMWTDAEANCGAVWAVKDDPRVTPLGKWLRKYRLDELPQLFNVLKGDMAIVGPRPERPEFVATLSEKIPFYQQRHCIKPGITGWAQISHKYSDSLEDTVTKLEYDLYYIRNLSPSLDAYIMFHTAKVMLLGRGAH